MERRGFEPLTPTLPVSCATNCANAPLVYIISQNKRDDNKCHHLFYGGAKEAKLELSIIKHIETLRTSNIEPLIYKIDKIITTTEAA